MMCQHTVYRTVPCNNEIKRVLASDNNTTTSTVVVIDTLNLDIMLSSESHNASHEKKTIENPKITLSKLMLGISEHNTF